jgi:hypothetical protein
LEIPKAYDLIIMKTNIKDFKHADPSAFFRVSECRAVVTGLYALSVAAQDFLERTLRAL